MVSEDTIVYVIQYELEELYEALKSQRNSKIQVSFYITILTIDYKGTYLCILDGKPDHVCHSPV